MGIIYAVVNQKGGVGKTTTSVNLAASLALQGKKVLLVDCDPQGNATSGLGAVLSEKQGTLFDLLVQEEEFSSCVMPTFLLLLDLLPSTLDLAGAEVQMIGRISRETILRDALLAARDTYDYILIDAPPSLGLLTVNTLVAAEKLIVPIQAEFYALEGVSHLIQTVELVRKHLNKKLMVAKVIMTMVDGRTKLAQDVTKEVKKYFGSKVSEVEVPRNIRLSEAPGYGKPAVVLDPKSKGALAYQKLAKELLEDE